MWEAGPEPDTIVARATAAGVGAVAVVRLSGPGVFGILREIASDLIDPPPARRATVARIHGPGGGAVLDQAVVTCFPGPASYTGEDVVEISGHGGWWAPALILDACVAAGARRAEPGEFTRRAYLNGKVDLIQAEAILDLVEGRSRALHDRALHQLERGLSGRIVEVRERLVDLEALLVHHIDFPEEDDPPIPAEQIVAEAGALAGLLATLLDTAPEGELLREGALTVLAGRPNSGKSSLFNALLGEERAIVTPEAGTTRDAIEAVVSMGGYPFRLVDTAGLRSAEEPVERRGVEVAHRYVERADLILFCSEAGRALTPEEERFVDTVAAPVVRVLTKSDLQPAAPGGPQDAHASVAASIVTGEGLGRLREALPAMVYRGLARLPEDSPVLTRERQRTAVARAHGEVRAFAESLEGGTPAEIAATHLRPAETALEEVLGVIVPEEILDRVFEQFCIGK